MLKAEGGGLTQLAGLDPDQALFVSHLNGHDCSYRVEEL